MPRSPKKVVEPPAPPTPSAEEKAVLREFFYDTFIMGAHPIILANVREKLSQLLALVGRPDLAARVDDWEQLLHD